MAALDKGSSQMADKSGDPLIGDRQSNIADTTIGVQVLTATAPATLTAGPPLALAVTFSANDPTGTPDGTITVADAAVVAAAELAEFWEAMEAHHTLGNTLAVELIADHATFKTLADELIVDHALVGLDLNDLATKVNAILDVLEEHGLMTAS